MSITWHQRFEQAKNIVLNILAGTGLLFVAGSVAATIVYVGTNYGQVFTGIFIGLVTCVFLHWIGADVHDNWSDT